MTARDRMRGLHSDPGFAADRDARSRDRFTARNTELQRKSNARRRGVDVPPELEEVWRALKGKRLTNQEAARFLGLKFKGKAGRRRPRRGIAAQGADK